jgi:hypothetical protein
VVHPFRLFATILASLFCIAAWAQPSSPAVRFLDREEAQAMLASPEEAVYYDRLEWGELQAKTGLAFEGMTLAAARRKVRALYASSTGEFAADEQRFIEQAVRALAPEMAEKAPLYLRTPWCFLKLSDALEGGMPHTRGDCIVLSPKGLTMLGLPGPRDPCRCGARTRHGASMATRSTRRSGHGTSVC